MVKNHAAGPGVLAPILFLAPAGLVLLMFMAYPVVSAVILSLQRWDGMSPAQFVGLRNYFLLLTDGVFLVSLLHTAYFTFATVVLQTIIPLLIAALLSAKIRGNTIFRTLYFLPVIISLTISGLLWSIIFEPNFGILNTALRSLNLGFLAKLWLADHFTVIPAIIVVSVWQSLGFYLVVFFAALQALPKEVLEAAEIDGANPIQKFFRVTLPMLRPVIILVVVLNTINGVKVFDQVWVMTAGGPSRASEMLGTYLYGTAFGAGGASNPQLGYAAAIAIIILLISIVLSIVQMRLGRRGGVQ